MNTASNVRKQTAFRLSEDLLNRLKTEAKRHNRSLNNLVESVLMAFVTNNTTLAAMKEAENPNELETLDLSKFRSFVDSL